MTDSSLIAEGIKEEPLVDPESAFHALDITEMEWDNIDIEVKKFEEQVLEGNAFSRLSHLECVDRKVCSSVVKALTSEQSQRYFRRGARLMQSCSSVNMIINSTRDLLDDFYLMSLCRKSLYCSRMQVAPLLVKCNECGKHFMGKGDRVLKLSYHIESKHHKIAVKLFLDLTQRYCALLDHMRKFLHMDQRLIAAHYD